jgi:hypothetical protein
MSEPSKACCGTFQFFYVGALYNGESFGRPLGHPTMFWEVQDVALGLQKQAEKGAVSRFVQLLHLKVFQKQF